MSDDPDANAGETLRLIGPDPRNWVPDRPGVDHNVVLVGGGQTKDLPFADADRARRWIEELMARSRCEL